jgi:hypothetical protein
VVLIAGDAVAHALQVEDQQDLHANREAGAVAEDHPQGGELEQREAGVREDWILALDAEQLEVPDGLHEVEVRSAQVEQEEGVELGHVEEEQADPEADPQHRQALD